MTKQVTAVLIGAGMRGMYSYAPYAIKRPHALKFIAVAEPDVERREEFKKIHGIADNMCFERSYDSSCADKLQGKIQPKWGLFFHGK